MYERDIERQLLQRANDELDRADKYEKELRTQLDDTCQKLVKALEELSFANEDAQILYDALFAVWENSDAISSQSTSAIALTHHENRTKKG